MLPFTITHSWLLTHCYSSSCRTPNQMQCEILGVLSSSSLGPISVHSLRLLYSCLVFLPKTRCIWLTVLRNGTSDKAFCHFSQESLLRQKLTLFSIHTSVGIPVWDGRFRKVPLFEILKKSNQLFLLPFANIFCISIKSMQCHHL